MFEIFASTSCSVHRESSAGDTKKLLIWVSLQVKCILASFGGLRVRRSYQTFIPITWYYIIAPRKRNVAQSRVHHSVH